MKNSSNSGFTIVELAVVLGVISLIVGTSLAFGAARIQTAKLQNTKDKMAIIMDTLRAYVKINGFIPCPADPGIPITTSGFGDGTGSGYDPDNCSEARDISGSLVYGAVPIVQLKLPPDFAVDGWGRKFTYVVDEDYTNPVYYSAGCQPPGSAVGCTNKGGSAIAGGIIIYNNDPAGAGRQIAPNNIDLHTDISPIIVLISHGTNGFYAWKANAAAPGEALGASADPSEIENDYTDRDFVQKPFTSAFDDIVEYRYKWQLCANYIYGCNPL